MNSQANLKKDLELPGMKEKTEKPDDIFTLMDYEDELQIRQAVMGRFVDIYVYSFDMWVDGRKVIQYGISWAGTKELIKTANIGRKVRFVVTDIPPVVEEHDTYWLSHVQTEDLKNGSKFWGTARQVKRKKGGQIDEHSCTISVSKAQRNSFRHQLPERMIIDFIRDYVNHKKGVKHIEPVEKTTAVVIKTPQPVDPRDFLETSVFNIADKLAIKMNLTLDAIINKELIQTYKNKKLEELSLDELKSLIRDLSAKYNKLVKATTEAAPAQTKLEES